MPDNHFDIVIIGSGPGGYVAAIRAAQAGFRTAIIEKNKIGGTCLTIGCIPTKSIIHQADLLNDLHQSQIHKIISNCPKFDFDKIIEKSWKTAERLSKGVEYLLQENKIEVFSGTGIPQPDKKVLVLRPDTPAQEISYQYLILAMGSEPRSLPGLQTDGRHIISSNDALQLKELPRSVAIIGAGAIGLEFAYIYATFGCKVTLVEMMPHIMPQEDEELSHLMTAQLKKLKMEIFTSARILQTERDNDQVRVVFRLEIPSQGSYPTQGSYPSQDAQITPISQERIVDKVLVAIGRRPVLDGPVLSDLGIELDRGYIKVNEYGMTSVPDIFAIGDIVPGLQLAHVASEEGLRVIDYLKGNPRPIRYESIPRCIYCRPQYASSGILADSQPGLSSVVFPYQAIGKAIAIDDYYGKIKLVFHPINKKILGVQILGAGATELIGNYVLAIDHGLSLNDLAHTVYAHPTLSEIVRESAELAVGTPIHVLPLKRNP